MLNAAFAAIFDPEFLVTVGPAASSGYALWAFYGVLAVGFVAAVSIGSVAWYNSKRPAGWEDKDRPTMVPKIDED
jgi:hypothetical protein